MAVLPVWWPALAAGFAGLVAGGSGTLAVVRWPRARKHGAPEPQAGPAQETAASPEAVHAAQTPSPVAPLSIAAGAEPKRAAGAPRTSGEVPPVARRIIEIRDSLYGASPTPELIALAYARLGTALEDLDVLTLEGAGPIDWDLQEPVGTKPAPDGSLDQTVASTVRPGYRYGGAIVRPQEVILYVARSGEG
jgi:hypothetical protein